MNTRISFFILMVLGLFLSCGPDKGNTGKGKTPPASKGDGLFRLDSSKHKLVSPLKPTDVIEIEPFVLERIQRFIEDHNASKKYCNEQECNENRHEISNHGKSVHSCGMRFIPDVDKRIFIYGDLNGDNKSDVAVNLQVEICKPGDWSQLYQINGYLIFLISNASNGYDLIEEPPSIRKKIPMGMARSIKDNKLWTNGFRISGSRGPGLPDIEWVCDFKYTGKDFEFISQGKEFRLGHGPKL